MLIPINTENERFESIYIDDELTNYMISTLGKVYNIDTGKELKTTINNSTGYVGVQLHHNRKSYYRLVHILVATAFIPNYDNKRTVNHKNGIKTDNYVNNLEWATDLENIQHAWKNNMCTTRSGEDCNFAYYCESDIHKVCNFLENKMSIKDIEIQTGVSYHTIRDILFYGTWKHVSKLYNIDSDYYRPPDLSFPKDIEYKIAELFKNNINITPKKVCKILNITYNNQVRRQIYKIKNKII